MRPILKFACATASVLLGACVCYGLFAIISPISASCSDLMSIINIIILCAVFVMICASGIVHYYMVSEVDEDKKVVDLRFCSSAVDSATSSEHQSAELCSICLAILSDKESELRKMNCCSNMVHAECMQRYCCVVLREKSKCPSCVFCRASLTLVQSVTV